jgi:chitinase
VSAGPAGYAFLAVPEMNKAIDYWNLMAYDYAGSWGNFVSIHHPPRTHACV